MKATGVVRRIDDLGRIVLPKELRRTMRIKEGESLEIFTDGDNMIVLKKYSPFSQIDSFVKDYVDSFNQTYKQNMIVCDLDKVIYSSLDGLYDKKITNSLDSIIKKRNTHISSKDQSLNIVDGISLSKDIIIKPINIYGDVLGCVIIESNEHITPFDESLADFSASYLSKYLES